ncbi:hypothetical protein CISG_05494 [Coccidioides immitis RMSCC 3703]|uniref:G-protein coupled receptors family 2 profile 2 domain-containing protein n=1 Tax=Coccidioides immitis RMSCC 3703 TaxID=454286 RepID=A0A0J8QUJ9_COCIT|nr:hypothetical protein CISG_05494 [Coccidioides immitis RMSCC 3703]
MDTSAVQVPRNNLTAAQLHSIDIAVRTCASVSVLACILVIGCYMFSRRFHTPLNRLIFYATWGNILAHLAELIARSGPRAGETSSLCRFQAFFIQWFTSADALWNLCIAWNVYLILFRHYGLPELRRLEWRYFILCYGLEFVPAMVFLFIETESKGRVYGDAIAHIPEQPGDESYSSLETLPELADLRRRQSLANIIDFERRLRASTEGQEKKARRLSLERHNAARAYAKFASIYFVSLIITWVWVAEPLL